MRQLAAKGNSREAVAIHESAHAVLCCAMSPLVRLKHVAIGGRGEGEYVASHEGGRAGVEADGVASAAGIQAELLAGQDEEVAWDAGRDDLASIEAALDQLGEPQDGRQFTRDRWHGRAAALVAKHFTVIEAVALALLQRGKLTGEDVETIVGRYRRQEAIR